MKITQTQKAYIYLHIAVLAYGFTAIIGALITINPLYLVWWRIGLTLVSFLFLLNFKFNIKCFSPKVLKKSFLAGLIITVHWICFYESIQLSNASVAVITLSTMPLFTAFLAPIFNRSKFEKIQVFIGLIIVFAMSLIFKFTAISYNLGIWIGLLAAFLSSLFTVINKELLAEAEVKSLCFLQLLSGFVLLSILLPFVHYFTNNLRFIPTGCDWVYLLFLSIVCTTMAFLYTSYALKVLSPFVVNLSINLEPIYGVLLAIIILNENKELSLGFYIGVFIIISSVFFYPIYKFFQKRKINKATLEKFT